ncbi:MAG: Signal peptidase I [Marinobacterium sp. xm-d-530]|jgi:signal peptidase I|nr:MAG: Signal peptidase I [Marinobacterium sp. xm-d-530]
MNLDFALILVVVTLVTGLLWLLDIAFFAPSRKRKESKMVEEGFEEPKVNKPYWAELSSSIFPVLAAVLILRSFLYEPFQIPSGSMLPTLKVGDFILVNKYHYGLRTPVGNIKFVDNNEPQRGDVMVFKYPQNPSVYYIKRVIGLPGDEIVYKDKVLFVNGEPQNQTLIAQIPAINPKRLQVEEQLGSVAHEIYRDVNARVMNGGWRVPEGHYFMMGDNRDNSNDSRYWGFVPDELVVGKAVSVWMHWAQLLSIPDFTAIRSIQ